MIPLAVPAIMGLTSLIGGMFGNKSKQETKPTLDPAFQGFQGQILKLMQQRLAGGGPSLQGYQQNGISGINHTFDLVSQHNANDLTARGLGSSPVAGVVEGNTQNARGGAINEFNNGLPLLQNDLQMRDLMASMGLLQQGRGQTTTGTQGGGIGGGLGSMAEILAYMYGSRPGAQA